jgi:hypothetical protein
LAKEVVKYRDKPFAKVLPLTYFDDFKEESLELKSYIEDRRLRVKPELVINAL